jgi:hypothetical protein
MPKEIISNIESNESKKFWNLPLSELLRKISYTTNPATSLIENIVGKNFEQIMNGEDFGCQKQSLSNNYGHVHLVKIKKENGMINLSCSDNETKLGGPNNSFEASFDIDTKKWSKRLNSNDIFIVDTAIRGSQTFVHFGKDGESYSTVINKIQNPTEAIKVIQERLKPKPKD